MHLALPTTKTFVYLCGGAAAAIVIYIVVGNAIEPAVGWEPRPWVETGIKIVFSAVVLVMVYSGWALMVRSIINFIAAFWMRLAAANSNRELAATVTRTASSARKVGDIIIVAGWMVWTLGLAIMVPAMVRDGSFS